ncbi:hypothetical protein GCM10022222_37930 [Amycolatopsis ultiminotia]|uniref:DUF1707 domain-containing protein n=1 Tax=Amycolatopsis ultiminotia TaxID=543629 RepID=A0ABP6WHY8_9PSEU
MADPKIRASDADREETVERLSHQVAAGRLSMDEFSERAARAYDAKTAGELTALTGDLPRPSPPRSPARKPNTVLIVALVAIVALIALGVLAVVLMGSMMGNMGPMHP